MTPQLTPKRTLPRTFTQIPVELAQGQLNKLTTAVTRNITNLKVNFCIVVEEE